VVGRSQQKECRDDEKRNRRGDKDTREAKLKKDETKTTNEGKRSSGKNSPTFLSYETDPTENHKIKGDTQIAR
jgi:hypothetical protein